MPEELTPTPPVGAVRPSPQFAGVSSSDATRVGLPEAVEAPNFAGVNRPALSGMPGELALQLCGHPGASEVRRWSEPPGRRRGSQGLQRGRDALARDARPELH